MAGGSNSKRPHHVNRATDSTNTQQGIIEGNNLQPQTQVQERVTVFDQHFYDGIPCFADVCFLHKSRSISKVSEVSLHLGRAGSIGCGMVLDTIGSSITSLNAGNGFASGAAIKGNGISILAFEVANTIVKGFNLLESLSAESIRHLKEKVLLSKGVQNLISEDMNELLRIVAADKRQELKVFSNEVIRFGNRSKDPQWHNLDRYLEKINRQLNGRLSRDEAESTTQRLMTLVHFTVKLYHELDAWDKLQQDFQRDDLAVLTAEIKNRKKQISHLKKKSLWSRSLEEVMEKLVDIVLFLHLEIINVFGNTDDHEPSIGHMSNCQRLGPAGLALHYANIVRQIDTLVTKSTMSAANTKDSLYQSLPPNIKLALRSKLPSFHAVEEQSVADIKSEMNKTLRWLVPMATKTSKAHHRFGWLGQWANTRYEVNRKGGVMWNETFHHADKDKVDHYILELLLWLHRLAIRRKTDCDAIAG
ncbi:protein PSK SIMULATOR 1-like isoform X2 [Phaseolus vulgaris]|uniref:protein PSK SIMULATOR 1-like isoform X2 n=1 Tax=Phaseolus vulgaris TaxID=3885 RepID=UPI0035CB00AB